MYAYAERERMFCLTFLFRRGRTIDRVTFDRAFVLERCPRMRCNAFCSNCSNTPEKWENTLVHYSIPRGDARTGKEGERDIYLPVCSSAKLLFEDQIEQTFPGSGFERGNSTSASGPVLEGRAGETHISNQLGREAVNRLADPPARARADSREWLDVDRLAGVFSESPAKGAACRSPVRAAGFIPADSGKRVSRGLFLICEQARVHRALSDHPLGKPGRQLDPR